MKRFRVLIAITLLALLLPCAAMATGRESQHINYITDIFNEVNGLPTGEANAIVQSSSGYIWLGSYGGLLRYDGSTFVDYSDRLASSAIRALFESRSQELYIGTNDAGAYRLVNDEFQQLLAEDSHIFLCVRGFAQAQDGTVYVASPSGAAKVSGDALIPYTYPELSGARLLSVAVDGFGNLWAMSDEGELYVFNDREFLRVIPSSELFGRDRIYALCSDDDGNLYVGSSGALVVKLTPLPDTVPGEIGSYERSEYSTGEISTINHLKAVYDGTVLVSALNGFGFISTDGAFRRVDKVGDNPLSANWAELDHEGNRWVASSNYGILRFSVGCFDSCNYNSDLAEYSINAVAKAGDRYYLGTDGGLLLFDEDWRRVENDLTEIVQGFRVRNVTVDTAGRVWMATYSSHGALCYNPVTEKITDYGKDQGLGSETVRVVYPLSDGRMLVGHQLGVDIITDGAITERYGEADGMDVTSVLCAMELNGRIFVGTDGSGIYEIADGTLKNYSFDQGLTQGVVLRMEPDADGSGNYFVCAGDKLFYCENGQFRVLSGISKGSGSIYSVYDVGGRIWLLQNAGVFSADKASVLAGEDTYTAHYGVKCGMTGTLSANTWNWYDAEGALYMPTRNGVSLFYFRGPSVTTPRAIVNSITVDDSVYEHPTGLELGRDANRVTVDISSLLFTDTSEFLLCYRLEGFEDTEYSTTDKHVSISYTNLKGGSYQLQVRIVEPLSGESRVSAAVPIVKEKRITEYVWFFPALAVVIAAVAFLISYGIIRYRTRRAEQRQRELKNIIDQSLTTIASTIDAKDIYTKGHSIRVATYSREIARRMGMSEEEQERIYYIGLLHDIGKIGVPDQVLNKRGKLDPEELAIIRRHPATGGEILKQFSALPGIGAGARYHHERYDGKGYCEGIGGKDIPLEARIIGIADSYDAMQSNRVYRVGMTDDFILNELKKGAGTQFDPEIVPVMLQMIEDGAAPIEYVGVEYDYTNMAVPAKDAAKS